ncbi:MAG: hypothetical protein KDK70_27935 [Myxococcales bacterium]|nr:hypothetical protein [Myxococcales bacterium]
MSSNVRNLVKLGDYYAANNQWSHAAQTYVLSLEQMYASLGRGQPMAPIPGLEDALRALHGSPPVALSEQAAASALAKLRDGHRGAHGSAELEAASFVTAFQSPGTTHWTVVYHERQELLPFDFQGDHEHESPHGDGSVPTGHSTSFVLKIDDHGIESVLLPKAKAAQIAYGLAHVAQARVAEAFGLYSEHQILDSDGVPLMMDAASGYRWSLALNPDNAWALAHFGEVYRDIANSWPGNDTSLLLPNRRVEHYIVALLYYERAIQADPESSWAHAHLGGAIVNVRAFVGFAYHSGKCNPLQALLDAWFPGKDPQVQYDDLLARATDSLSIAQRLKGNFYPWAQVYYAGSLLIKAGASRNPADAQLAQLAFVSVMDAYFLQPSLIAESFEPGELYVNSYFQVSLLYLWLERFSLAWAYAYMGMRRTFKFHFIPGLQDLMGLQLLVNVGAATSGVVTSEITEGEVAEGGEVAAGVFPHGPGDALSVNGVSIPATPIGTEAELLEFIDATVQHVASPTVAPYLCRGIAINTNIRMGLLQAFFILYNFLSVMTLADGDGPSSAGTNRIKDLMEEILTKLSGDDKDGDYYQRYQRYIDDRLSPEARYSHHLNDMFTFMNTGRPGYNMCID